MFKKLFGEVEGIFNIVTLIDLSVSFIYIILGIIFFIVPLMSNVIVSVISGLFLIANGVNLIYSYFKNDEIILFDFNLHYGTIFVIIGLFIVFLNNIFSIFLALYLIVSAVQKIHWGIILKNLNESSWLITLVIGVLFVIIAIISFFAKSDVLIKVSGIVLFGLGMLNFIDTILLRHRFIYFLSSKIDV